MKEKIKNNIIESLTKYHIYSEKSREDFYYPDVPKNIEENYDTTGVLDDMECINNILKSKFHESFNINRHQSLLKYDPMMRPKYKNEFGHWGPKGHLVSTINDYSMCLNSIKAVDVSVDSEYWATISNRKFYHESQQYIGNIKMWNSKDLYNVTNIFDINTLHDLNCITMMENSYSFAVGTEFGSLDLYSPFEFEEHSITQASKDDKLKSCYIMHKVNHKNEGAIIACENYLFEAEREHCIVYANQKGYLHVYDIRSRNPAMSYNVGMENG